MDSMDEKNSVAPAPTVGPSSSSPAAGPAPADPKVKLTEKQRAAYDLTRPEKEGGQGKTYAEAAAILGISKPVVSKTLQAVYRKLGLKKEQRGHEVKQATEFKNPEKAAAIVDALTDPLEKVKDALVAAGFPGKVSDSVLRRLRVKYFGAITEVKAFKTQELVRMCEEKLGMINHYLDDKVMAEASARDLGLMAGVLIEKRQLLRGEPTQIISNDDRKKLHELLPALIAEGNRRRGITVQGEVTERTLEPQRTPA